MSRPTVLITGAAKRIGQAVALAFAERGFDLAIHYNHSRIEAEKVQSKISQRSNCRCELLQGKLDQPDTPQQLVAQCIEKFGRLDQLVNNASIFFPTPVDEADETQLNQFMQINCFAPKQLALQAFPFLQKANGSIVNLIDIYAEAGLTEHSLYVASKSSLKALTQEMAIEFAPIVRVNGVSPGAILWPEHDNEESDSQKAILDATATKSLGTPESIAATVIFLALSANYITGNVIKVDGGRRDYI